MCSNKINKRDLNDLKAKNDAPSGDRTQGKKTAKRVSFFVGRWKIRFRNKPEPLTTKRRRWRCTCPKGVVERLSGGLFYKALLKFGMKSCE
jgi:hypothetical protein